MSTNDNKQSGFGILLVVIIILVLASLTILGYRLYGNYNKPSAISNTSSIAQTNTQTNTQTQTIDPYAGWKTYCDDARKVCFQYPADWMISSYSNNGMYSAIVKSPNMNLEVDYSGYYAIDGRDTSYYIASINDLTKPTISWKIVGRILSSDPKNSVPEYQLVDESIAAGLKVNQTASMADTARFTFKDQTTGHLDAYSINANSNANDADTLLSIEKSFYLE